MGKETDNWTYIWCGSNDATHVIGKLAGSLTNWVTPMADIERMAQGTDWDTIGPIFLSTRAIKKQPKKSGRHFRVLDGEISFMSAGDELL